MKRRTFLTSMTAGVLATAARATQPENVFNPARVLCIIPDIGPSTAPETLQAALQALTRQALPASIIIRPGDGAAPALTPNMPLAGILRNFSARFPGLIEIVAWSSGLGRKQPFEVARAATEARSILISSVWGSGQSDVPSTAIVSIATDFAIEEFSVGDVISAGFQNVVILSQSNVPPEARLDPRGVLTILGGEPTSLDGAEALVRRAPSNTQVQLILPVATFEKDGLPGLDASVAQVAATVRSRELSGQVTTLLTRDLLMRTDTRHKRRLALHLFKAQPDDDVAGHAVLEFRKKLDEQGIRYSIGKPLPSSDGHWHVDEGYWISRPRNRERTAANGPDNPLTSVRRTQGSGNSGWQSDQPLEPGVAVILSAGSAGECGFDGDLSLHVPVLQYMADGPRSGNDVAPGSAMTGEGLIVIGPGALATTAQRIAVLRKLRKLTDGGAAELIPLNEFAVSRLPKDRVLPTLLQTARYRATRKRNPGFAGNRREDLIADAKAAWRYFEKGTNPKTGLCASTTVRGEPASGYVSATMWEVGSQVNALIAALALGLIDDDDFKSWTQVLLKTLGRTVAAGRLQPPEWIDTRTGRSSRNFNSFDTGRLLLALDHLRHHRLAPKNLDKLVASWDFEKVILNRRAHSIVDGKLVDDYSSLYAEYAATGFRAWGFDVTSPFEFLPTATTSDQQMALLYTVARIGPIGAEPILLELLDRNASPIADYLADVLFAAQLDLFERTGQLVFPSESPLDRSPWFTFQGYNVEMSDNPWSVKFDSNDPRVQTAAFKKAARANSSKAAYLWHAVRQSDVSQMMVDRTRALARSDVGFLSAVYVESGDPTWMYSDLNTNSVILQSIAFLA